MLHIFIRILFRFLQDCLSFCDCLGACWWKHQLPLTSNTVRKFCNSCCYSCPFLSFARYSLQVAGLYTHFMIVPIWRMILSLWNADICNMAVCLDQGPIWSSERILQGPTWRLWELSEFNSEEVLPPCELAPSRTSVLFLCVTGILTFPVVLNTTIESVLHKLQTLSLWNLFRMLDVKSSTTCFPVIWREKMKITKSK